MDNAPLVMLKEEAADSDVWGLPHGCAICHIAFAVGYDATEHAAQHAEEGHGLYAMSWHSDDHVIHLLVACRHQQSYERKLSCAAYQANPKAVALSATKFWIDSAQMIVDNCAKCVADKREAACH